VSVIFLEELRKTTEYLDNEKTFEENVATPQHMICVHM